MLADQYGEGRPAAYIGSFGREPIRSTRTTARIEGIVSAYRLASGPATTGRRRILTAMLRTVPHLLQLQFT